jgi:hypothetical protein
VAIFVQSQCEKLRKAAEEFGSVLKGATDFSYQMPQNKKDLQILNL